MRIPSWVVYSFVLAVLVAGLFWAGAQMQSPAARPAPLQVAEVPDSTDGPRLPDADPFDENVLVQVGDAEDGIGTAFAINESGVWLTARHVVDGCSRVGLAVGDGRMVRVNRVKTSKSSDLALLITDRAPAALPMHLDQELRIGEAGYHVGFPQGRSGEAYSRLQARSKLVTSGRYKMEEPVLAWAERERSEGIEGTLSGMSGGPVFDKDGAVVGVTVAENPRRGRIYTAAPSSIAKFLDEQGLVNPSSDTHPFAESSYVHEADELREERAVVKVLCRVGDK